MKKVAFYWKKKKKKKKAEHTFFVSKKKLKYKAPKVREMSLSGPYTIMILVNIKLKNSEIMFLSPFYFFSPTLHHSISLGHSVATSPSANHHVQYYISVET